MTRTSALISVLAAFAAGVVLVALAEETISVSGTVTGSGGPAVAGALVEALFPWGLQATATTDAEGRYQLSITPGPISLHVRAPVVERLSDTFVDIGFREQSFTQDFQLQPGHLLGGSIRMPDGGAAAAGVGVLLHPVSFVPSASHWLKTTSIAAGNFEIVAPAGVYWVGVEPPAHTFSVAQPADLRTGDAEGIVVTLSARLFDPVPLDPPDATEITFGEPDGLGEVTVTGAAGSVMGLGHVVLVNLGSLQQADTVSEDDGSFSSRIFAPPGSAILVKHGAMPTSFWDELEGGVSMKLSPFPGAIIHRPIGDTADGEGQPFAAVGTSDFVVDFLPETDNSVDSAWVVSGFSGPSEVLGPGDEIRVQGTVRVYSPAIDSSSDLTEAALMANLGLRMISNSDGRPVAGSPFMSSRLTPTGFPIQGSSGDHSSLSLSAVVDSFTVGEGQFAEGELEITGQLPSDLAPGLYRPLLTVTTSGFPEGTSWLAAEVYSVAHEASQAMLPPIVVTGGIDEPRRLIWRLLMEDPVQGGRGTGAIEDRGSFEFAQQITSQGAPYWVPPVDEGGRPMSYRLEPFLPRISFADRRIPSSPLIPFQLPGGVLNVAIERPDGTVRDLGSAEFVQSMSRSATTGSGAELNPATTQINDAYSLTTNDPRFRVTFDQYGRHFVIMTGAIEDVWGHAYQGGGTYEVWVAHTLDIDPGVLPGTPLAIGDAFNPVIRVSPAVPAEVALVVTLHPDSDPDLATVQAVEGRCNGHGVFSPTDAEIVLDAPGEYRVDLTARYWTPSGELYMGAMTWGGVVMTPPGEAELVAHGRRGLDSLEEIPDQSWFVSARDLEIPAGAISHFYNPYYNGDMLWTRFEDVTGIADGGDSLILGASVHDTVGDIEQAIAGRGETMRLETTPPGTLSERIQAGEIPLFSSTTTGRSPLVTPSDVDQIAYSYRSSQRPGARVREVVAEDPQSGGYWRLDTVYDDQLGVGVLGDQPNDFKFQYLGIVYRDLESGHSEYLGHGSGWIFIPDSDPFTSRCMPPFAGTGNGGWTTEGGPILTLDGVDVDIFILPTAIRPGAVLEVGDVFRFAGHVMPTLDSEVAATVTSPSGVQRQVDGQANPIGYFYDREDDFIVEESGVWTVDVKVWHDGSCSGGQTVSPYPSGDVLGSDDGRYSFYVPTVGEPPLQIISPHPGMLVVGDQVEPIDVRGRVPREIDAEAVYYTISMPGYILKTGLAEVVGGQFEVRYDPVTLHTRFPNIDLFGRDDPSPGVVDTVSIAVLLKGSRGGEEVFLANTVTLQGQQVSIGNRLPRLQQPPRPGGRRIP
jgi:hypothetical protein